MEVSRIRDITTYIDKTPYLFIYFYENWCKKYTDMIDLYFKNKYDLNKKYVKVHIKNKKIIEDLQVTSFPSLKIYNNKELYDDISCGDNIIDIINNIYIFLK